MSDYGYAMFGDNAAWVDGYGENLYSVFHDDLEDINNLKKKIAEAWDEDVETEVIPADLEVLARERTGEQIAEDFDPTDIVDDAGAWDIPELASWAFERGVFEDVPGVKTRDGAVVWDNNIIHKGDKDADVWGEDAEKNRVGAENYNQSAGECAMTANAEKLQEAKAMLAQAEAAEEKPDMKAIYQKTGWHLGADGKWRFEIPDNLDEINLRKLALEGEGYLKDIYANPALYEAYPWLAYVKVAAEDMEYGKNGYAKGEEKIALSKSMVGKNPAGSQKRMIEALEDDNSKAAVEYAFKNIAEDGRLPNDTTIKQIAEKLPDKYFFDTEPLDPFSDAGLERMLSDDVREYTQEERIAILKKQFTDTLNDMRPNDKIKETLVHEVQHIIQNAEDFAAGGNPKYVNEQMKHQLLKYDEEIKRIHPKAWEYQKALLEYDIADWDHAMGEISDEEFQERKDEVTELEEQIPEDKVKRIKKIYELRADLQWKAENEDAKAFDNYHNLHGEQEARAASMKARLYTMGASQERIDNEVLNGVDSASAIIVFAGQSYSMDAGQKGLYKIKGQTAFKANGKKVISLFKAADQSTFMHEMAHVYLHDMLELAKLPNAPQQLIDDVKTLSEWASWRPETFDKEYKGTALEREFRKMHEQIADATKYGYLIIDDRKVTLEQLKLQWAQERFARGFENYLREGKAPTESVKTIFRRFKEWLGTIYKAFIQIGGAPSKEVCAVMDRMIASEEEIDIAMSKKGVDSFADAGGMEYLEGNAKQIYMRMVERAKAEAKEKVLKIALKDVKEDYRKQEKEFFAQEEAEYREKLQAEPVFVIQEHINNNPDLSTSAICETLGMSVEEYVAKLKEYGGSLDAAVKAHMREFKKGIDNSGFDAQYFREKAEALVEESKYRKLASTMELNIFEQLAKAQKKINAQSVKNMTLTNDEKGVMGTVDKLNKQSQKIEKLEAEKKEGIAKHREEKEQIIANVRGLRDAALKHYQEFVDYVERKLETMPIEDANNYQMWRRKSAEAQHNSERAIVSGKWELAVKYKRAQVIYDMFADRAVRNDKKIKKIEEQLTKRRQSIIKNKNISANERYAYNHMLYVFGFVDADAPIPPRYQEENGFMGVLQKSDAPRAVDGLFMECPFFTADGFLNLPEWLVSAAMGTTKREQGHKDLSNEQMKMLAQVMNIIYKRGVDDMTLKTIRSVDGKQMSVDDAIAEITAQVRQRIVERTVRDSTGAGDMTKREKAERAINDANQYLVKPEVILKKMGDLAVKYIYEPLKIAADKELRMAGDMQKKLQNLYSGYSAEELYAMRNDAKYKIGTSMITKEKVIMLALNWGTEINAKRVMDGFHVSELDVKKVLANLTEQDWNLVNDIWSLYDEHWDEVRDIEARMTGAVLEKQPNRAFTIIGNDGKSYTLEGGYFPIKYDPRDQRTQEQKADAAAMQQASMSNVAMSLGKGFLKDRTNAKVERRLDLRFEIISGSLADVIHLVAFREPIRDVRRIVLRDDFRSLVNNYLGETEYKHLRKWTTDCWAEEPIAQSRFEIIAAKLRNAQTMGMMSFRVMTAALNIANAPIVAHYMGTVDMLHALKRFYSAPRKYIDFIFQRSVFMAERAETMDANIYDAIKGPHFMDNVPGVGKAGNFLREHAFKLITWTDLMLALPLWQHEYEKAYNDAVENGRSPQQAQDAGVSAGDAAVRWCFGSGRTVDKAAVQRGRSEFMKQLTMYYSYMSTVYNALNYELWDAKMGYKQAMTWADANKNKELLKAVVKASGALLAWQLLPAVITALFRAGTSGDDDDLEPEKLLKSITSETLSTLVGGIPVLRDAVPYLLARAFDEKQFAPRIPIQNTIEQTNRVIQSITNDKKTFGDVMRESGKLLSQTTGAPSTLVDALTTSITYLETGFDADVSEYLRALILDKKLKSKK
ncbi:LPD23 domain-containing protein [Phascolarctobacterium succinatutens]|uniref:LPD23 domain-containing protein n=1 Tax=Phascolarctobacterium succinatutens TaxID=626940 RepID=UPI0026EDDDC0|nr:LPD23 domain-containing protein [Phascolarctobacterium succinatutens]